MTSLDPCADLPSSVLSADAGALPRLVQAFHANGFVILRGFADEPACAALEAVTREHLAAAVPPVEFEADLGYPGAPAARDAAGGGTVRRLRQAYGRDEVFRRWASDPQLVAVVQALLGEPARITLAHHNCVMTKHPHYGSQTGWHRDTRYWSFARPELVTVWLALGDEDERNGVLRVIPGSHQAKLEPGQLDPAEFLIEAHPASQPLLDAAQPLALHRGDVLFFDSRLFHAAGRNASNAVKLSVAFAYFGASNRPLDGTRSAEFGSVELPAAV
ncbi:Phytanoyl-CoA dioxygenase (PhyH) [compost metagenome]|jgi:phytanoyl-CoA hydroxylase|uniref:phytanoyl-CoA dioxygenase family protein n=1 Tax=Cupriavidus necator TaxID=106590 RepID=UPI0028B42867